MTTTGAALVTHLPTIEVVMERHAAALGADALWYRHHAYRVANLCARISGADTDRLDKIAVAAAFHDLGIWTAGTFDYLEPSIALALDHLARSGRSAWSSEIAAMIGEHHKLSRCPDSVSGLVEAFRQADWIDVTAGVRRFAMPRAAIADLGAAWPYAGFHRRLLQLSLGRLRSHPFSPLPMIRL